MANPMYRQIAEDLHEQIESGPLQPDQQLPIELDARHRYRASRNTVRDAIKWLMNLGLAGARSGLGTFVQTADVPKSHVREARKTTSRSPRLRPGKPVRSDSASGPGREAGTARTSSWICSAHIAPNSRPP